MLQVTQNLASDEHTPDSQLTGLEARELARQCVDAVSTVLWGNREVVRMVIATVLARGHVLLEDVPGVGKTTLARAVARVLGSSFARIQFTADMLPSDVLGIQVLDSELGDFHFKPGPIMHQLVLADEVNRASPKTQSAMLEAMAEGAVTIDDRTYQLPKPFGVLATQNPVEHHGAYPLPESQLDRFMASLSVGYPGDEAERALLLEPTKPLSTLSELQPVLTTPQLLAIQERVAEVEISDVIADYLLAIIHSTRNHPDIVLGCSPRGSQAFACMVRAWAFMDGRAFVIPDDVKALANAILTHRMVVGGANAGVNRHLAVAAVDEIVSQVPVPR